jgi:phosphotransacetylase
VDTATELSERGWAKPVLLAAPEALRDLCVQHGTRLRGAEVLDPALAQQLDAYAAQLRTRRPELSEEAARTQMKDPLWYAAMMLANGDADYCIAGNLSATASVLRAALRVVGLAEGIKTLSSMFFMMAQDRSHVLAFGDCGVVPVPTSEQLADIAISTAANYQQVTGQVPRVAMLSFSTRGSAKHAAAEHVAAAVALVKQRQPDLLVDGEMQFDAAYVPHVAAQKAPGSPVAGQANVFIFPSLEAGNIAYKVAERLGGYTALGPMLQGLSLPMHDLSRGCSVADMIHVTLLAMKMNPKSQQAASAHTNSHREAGMTANSLSV